MIDQLREQIKIVIGARQKSQQVSEAKKFSLGKWEQENLTLLNEVALTTQQTSEAEDRLRELTLEAYAKTGNKAPAQGVGIRVVTKLEYDRVNAFNWAKEHAIALKLDISAFEKIAKVSPPEFVIISPEPQATIATHLEEIK